MYYCFHIQRELLSLNGAQIRDFLSTDAVLRVRNSALDQAGWMLREKRSPIKKEGAQEWGASGGRWARKRLSCRGNMEEGKKGGDKCADVWERISRPVE